MRRRIAEGLTRRRDLPFAGIRTDWDLPALNGERLLVRGRERHPVPETLYATSYWGELQLSTRQALGYLLAPTGQLVLRRRIIGDLSVAEYEAKGARDQELSLQAALLAAGALLGIPGRVEGAGVHVDAVNHKGPNAGKVRAGDVVTHVDGERVSVLPEFLTALEGRESAQVEFLVAQDGSRKGLVERTELSRDEDGRWGVEVRTHRQHVVPSLDVEVAYPEGTAGSSTGLILALSVLDVLTPGSITGGRRVAGTGALDPGGDVLPVGGAGKKVQAVVHHGIETFLVPAENVEEARAVAGGRCEVLAVSTLGEAVEILVSRGGTSPHLP